MPVWQVLEYRLYEKLCYLLCTVFHFVCIYKYYFLLKSKYLAGLSFIPVADFRSSCTPVYAAHLPPPQEALDCLTCFTTESPVLNNDLAQLLRAHSRPGPGHQAYKASTTTVGLSSSCLTRGPLNGVLTTYYPSPHPQHLDIHIQHVSTQQHIDGYYTLLPKLLTRLHMTLKVNTHTVLPRQPRSG